MNELEEQHIQNVVLRTIQSGISRKISTYENSFMSKSMKMQVTKDFAMDSIDTIIKWMNVAHEHNPIVIEKEVEYLYPANWWEHLKRDNKFIRKIFGSCKKLTTVKVKFEFTFNPTTIFVDAPDIPQLRECQFVRFVVNKPTVKFWDYIK